MRANGEIFEREMAQPLERRTGRETPGGDVGEQGLELLGSHATAATGSRYSRKIASASAIDSIWKSRWRSVARAVQPLGVPAEVLAELDHRPAGVALEAERQPRVLERHPEPLGGVRRGAARLRPSSSACAVAEEPRIAERAAADHDAGAAGVIAHAHDVLGGLRCRRCR